jgi:ligand-binding SRPBCC domain-containing protein
MSASPSFTFVSHLRAPPERVWDHASSFAGVNRELGPLVRMTHPAGVPRLTPAAFPPGRTAFRSWLLLFGLLPIDFDDIALVELEPGRGFSEVSRTLNLREWRHRRSIAPAPGGCEVRDDIGLVPYWRPAGPVLAWVYRVVFRWRHAVLRRLFGRAGR